MTLDIQELDNRLWSVADQLRVNSQLRSSRFSVPVRGLILLRYAGQSFELVHEELGETIQGSSRRQGIGSEEYHARGVLRLPEKPSHPGNVPGRPSQPSLLVSAPCSGGDYD